LAKRGFYVVLDGIEGQGKTTQVKMLDETLLNAYVSHVVTSEPGTKLSPLTMQLRQLILDNSVQGMTPLARELMFQAARSSVLDTVVAPHLEAGHVVISDRGVLSGLAYSKAAGFDESVSLSLLELTTREFRNKTKRDIGFIYDIIILLDGNSKNGLERASERKEFAAGDAIESRGLDYMERVRQCFQDLVAPKNKHNFVFRCPMVTIQVDGKSRKDIHREILQVLIAHHILPDHVLSTL